MLVLTTLRSSHKQMVKAREAKFNSALGHKWSFCPLATFIFRKLSK